MKIAYISITGDYENKMIEKILDVSIGYIGGWKQAYERDGFEGLRLQHKGYLSYLSAQQREEMLSGFQSKDYWKIGELKDHLADHYDLFEIAGVS